MDILELLGKTVESKASDLHITVAMAPSMRVNGQIIRMGDTSLSMTDTEELVSQMLTPEQKQRLDSEGELDFSFANAGLGRFRVNAYKQRGSYGVAIRTVATKIPSMDDLGLPTNVLTELCNKQRGLVLITGPTGSGKSTTLASMIDYINNSRSAHILTLEDPIEYLHRHKKSIVNQREVGNDTKSFANALRAALRQDPDVILVGEMRDLETISTAITAAETGHLVMSTLHTIGAAKTVDRIIDVFPPHQQQQVKVQLAGVMSGVVSQQLIARSDIKGRVAALEIMIATPAIKNLIREGKTHQIPTSVQTGGKFGMKSMDNSLIELLRRRIISRESVLEYCVDADNIERLIGFQ